MSPVATASDLAAGAVIQLDGTTLDPSIGAQLAELRVETTTGLPDVCVLRLIEKAGVTDGTLPIIDDAKLKLGATLVVKLGSAIGGGVKPVFDGEITGVEVELGRSFDDTPRLELTVTAHDRSHRLHGASSSRTLRQVSATDIARKVAGEHGLKVGKLANLPGGTHEVVHQVGESDWTFLSRIVREHGGELDVEQGALSITDPAATASPVATLIYGESLRHFRARISSLGQVGEVVVRSWDPKKKEAIAGSAKPAAATAANGSSVAAQVSRAKAVLTTGRVASTAAANAQATALATRIAHERVQGDAIAVGDPVLLAGAYVKVQGVGIRFGGTHRIVSAVHVYGTQGYETRLVLGAGGRPVAEAVRGGGTTDFASHLAIGIVTSNDDPEKLGRVKVKYPTLAEEVESDWVRMVYGAAGNERGSVALPHVNDEVIVGFVHGDVHRPFVLGALFNGKDKPGADLVKAASSYAARFPRDLDVLTKEKVILGADKGATVSSSAGPLELKAAKELKLSAGTGGSGAATIEATGQLKAEGKQGIELASNGPIKIKTNAPITIESSAMLQLKGSIVQVQASGILQLSGATVMLG